MRFAKKVYLLVALLVIMVMTASSSFFLFTQSRALDDALAQQGTSLVESLAEGVRLGVVLEDAEFVKQAAGSMLGLPDLLFIDVYLNNQTRLAGLGSFAKVHQPTEQEFKQATITGNVQTRLNKQETGIAARSYMVPVYLDNAQNSAGFVRLGLSTRLVTEKWQAAITTTIWVTILLIIISCLIAYFLVARFTQPLQRLAEGALHISNGELDVKIETASDDEIGRLADNFNTMAESLRREHQQVVLKTADLKASESKFRNLFERIGQPLYICDLNGKLLDCNRAMIDVFGYINQQEMMDTIQSGDQLYMNPEDRQQVLQLLMKSGEIKGLEVIYSKKNGDAVHGLLTARARLDDNHKTIGFEGMIQDVTELRDLEAQLFHSQKMEAIGTLAGGIAHDFNNLLTVILTSAELGKKRSAKQGVTIEPFNHIITAGNRAAELTRNLLGFARKGKTRVEKMRPDELLDEVGLLMKETMDRSIRFTIEKDEETWPIEGNPSQIHQVLINLCVNARDAILDSEGSELKLSVCNEYIDADFSAQHQAAHEGCYVRIDVTDDGSGIPEKLRKNIFDPFFTTKEIGKGTGLGLATVYGIIQNHGGFLTLDSEENKGTTFHLYFPALASEADSHMPVAVSSEVTHHIHELNSSSSAPLVLLADDEELLRAVGIAYLDELGYRTIEAASGEEALAIVDMPDSEVDLVILDLMMPGIGGLQALKELKRQHPSLPVIIVSGYSHDSVRKDMQLESYDGFLEKPYTLEKFSHAVAEALKEPVTSE